MALGTYSDLVASIQSWMFDRSDIGTVCPDFIALAEGEFNRVLRTREQIAIATLTPDVNSQITLPVDYLQFRNVVALGNPRWELQNVAPTWRDDAFAYRYSGQPAVFSLDGDKVTILPTTALNIELEYYAKIPALGPSSPTNWLLTKSPNAYLAGCLKHACIYIGNEQRAAMFGEQMNGALDQILSDDRAAVYSRAGARKSGPTP
ncbi:hypothetical protein [Mesorhizobium sp. Pch-S]|uniref:phage adaptor protein n=1 Tax=Mesorhizobium sp. Pch-S TaxID=2082387 RepID=UPI0010102153|nr:hypothetical protein [Mesorhizobium sp. Pch-S]QAZ46766.1 hypothetical protein C1M53_31425 [Mesorhizobium sp. Pch-S]